MEFWGIEVKPGRPVKVTPEKDTLIHLSQASLGECKNKKEEVVVMHVKVDDQKLVLGNLTTENIPQIFCDLVFEKEFELSHNWGKGSVYFVGYKSPNVADNEGEDFSDSEEEEEEEIEEVPATITANGNAAKAAKPEAKPAQVTKNAKPADDDEGMDVDDDEDSEDEEKTPTPKKPVSSKKRANEEAPKTPVSSKKAKVAAVTPQKTDDKKKGTATQSPKSASQVSCGSCKKTFNSGNALESHNKAKHAAAK